MRYAPQTDLDHPRLAHLHRSVRFWRFTALLSTALGGAIIAALLYLLAST